MYTFQRFVLRFAYFEDMDKTIKYYGGFFLMLVQNREAQTQTDVLKEVYSSDGVDFR